MSRIVLAIKFNREATISIRMILKVQPSVYSDYDKEEYMYPEYWDPKSDNLGFHFMRHGI
jgi:hypothetical protein